MPSQLDEICPSEVGERRVVLTLSEETLLPRAFNVVDVLLDFAGTEPEGIVLPLLLRVVAPSRSGYLRKVYQRVTPSLFTFIPREGGRHVVSIREVAHNRWWGALNIDVAGDKADPR